MIYNLLTIWKKTEHFCFSHILVNPPRWDLVFIKGRIFLRGEWSGTTLWASISFSGAKSICHALPAAQLNPAAELQSCFTSRGSGRESCFLSFLVSPPLTHPGPLRKLMQFQEIPLMTSRGRIRLIGIPVIEEAQSIFQKLSLCTQRTYEDLGG